ncbi:MAG: cytochrome c [Ardenticatenaceae bacterium]|nr:cytochrome c [Ardenticatenaceae bacterium]
MLRRNVVTLVSALLLGGVLVVLAACGGSSPAPSVPQATATAEPPVPTATPALTSASLPANPAPQATATAEPPAATATAEPPAPTATSAPTATAGSDAPADPAPDDELLAKGKLIFEKTAGGVGCASCHGMDGKGNTKIGAPDNRGATEEQVRTALSGGVEMMSFIKLTDDEITAVVAYLKYLSEQP